ncbi:MAG: MFS transporter [Euryarchaeota archaeon]|jgi:MFS family permease|nr:MFS transporter [Euryarchaeota archaeon]MBT7938821.1 MFS transporter [Euryarchaeota archaeon]
MTEAKTAGQGSLLIITIVVLVDMIGFGIIIPFLTFMVAHLSGPDAEIGFWVATLMSGYAAAVFLFSSFWGSLSDKYGRRPILMIGLLGNTGTFILFGLSTTLWMAFVARVLSGIFNANIPVARAYISDVSKPHEVAKRQGLLGVAFGVGFTIGPALGGWLSRPAEWNWTSFFQDTIFDSNPYLLPCIASSLLSGIAFLLSIWWLPESLPLESRSKTKNTNPLRELKRKFKDISALLSRPILSPLMWSAMAFWIGFTIMHVSFILFTMMSPQQGGLGFSESDNGLVFGFIGLSGLLVQGVLIGPLTKRFGSSRLMAFGLVSAAIGLTLTPYVDISFAWSGILLVSFMIALGNGLFTPSNMAMLSNHSESSEKGLVMGVAESLRSLSTLFGVLIGGIIWDLTNTEQGFFTYHTVFWLCGIFSIIGLFIHIIGGAWNASDPALEGVGIDE